MKIVTCTGYLYLDFGIDCLTDLLCVMYNYIATCTSLLTMKTIIGQILIQCMLLTHAVILHMVLM